MSEYDPENNAVSALKVPPHSNEAEQSVLGGLMLDDQSWFDLIEVVADTDFYRTQHQIIFAAMNELATDDAPLDAVTVSERLQSRGLLEKAGGIAYLAELTESTPGTSNILAYGKIVRERSVLRQLIGAANQIVDSAFTPDGRDTDTLLELAEQSVFQIAENRKTAFAVNMVEHAAMSGGAVLVFSMEMPAEQIVMRMISSLGRIDQTRLRNGELKDEDWTRFTGAVSQLKDKRLYIDDTPALTPGEVRSRARRVSREAGGLDMIVIDYLQLMRTAKASENRATEISEISRSLKALAKEMSCPVIALSQLNRQLESRPDKRPMNSDLRESGAIEQDADVILFIYRDEVYNENSEDIGLAEIIIGKQRNGPIGKVKMKFTGNLTKFEDLAHEMYNDFSE